MSDQLTIGQLAKRAGVQTSTLRYYERADLLTPSGRTDGNYRVYTLDALERVRFIRVAQAAGFSLDDISALLGIRDGTTTPCGEVEQLIDHRLTEVRARLKDLREIEHHLKDFSSICQNSAEKDHCEVLDQLTEESANS
jgi:MerR family mercuric resistance operon transcriptional regulator